MAVDGGAVLVQTDIVAGTATLTVCGEVDISTVADLWEGLVQAMSTGPSRLVIDLGSTAFIDCSAMNAIAQAYGDAPPGCQFVLRSPSRLARRVIELTGMDRLCLVDR